MSITIPGSIYTGPKSAAEESAKRAEEEAAKVLPCPVCEARRKRLAEKMRAWRAKKNAVR